MSKLPVTHQITQDELKATDLNTLQSWYGRGINDKGKNKGQPWSDNTVDKRKNPWAKHVVGLKGDLTCPVTLAEAMARYWDETGKGCKKHGDRCTAYSAMRGTIRHYLFLHDASGDEAVAFKKQTELGWRRIGGTDMKEYAVRPAAAPAQAAAGEDTPAVVVSKPDPQQVKKAGKAMEQRMAFRIFTESHMWTTVVNGNTIAFASPMPQRSLDLCVGLGQSSAWKNYITKRDGKWVFVANEFKTWSPNHRYVAESTPGPVLQAMLDLYISAMSDEFGVLDNPHRFLFPHALVVHANGTINKTATMDTLSKYISDTHHAIAEAHQLKDREVGISAHRASFIQHCVEHPGEYQPQGTELNKYRAHHVYMNCLAPAMRHSAEVQTHTYNTKADVIPWELCREWAEP